MFWGQRFCLCPGLSTRTILLSTPVSHPYCVSILMVSLLILSVETSDGTTAVVNTLEWLSWILIHNNLVSINLSSYYDWINFTKNVICQMSMSLCLTHGTIWPWMWGIPRNPLLQCNEMVIFFQHYATVLSVIFDLVCCHIFWWGSGVSPLSVISSESHILHFT